MRKLLLFLTVLSLTYISFAQVPENDIISNATLIDPSSFVEENLRLDLTTDSGVSPLDCGTAGFNTAYYKFTATADVNINATMTDMLNGTITESFLIFYNAPDLNQTDESQLSVASPCIFGTTPNCLNC